MMLHLIRCTNKNRPWTRYLYHAVRMLLSRSSHNWRDKDRSHRIYEIEKYMDDFGDRRISLDL